MAEKDGAGGGSCCEKDRYAKRINKIRLLDRRVGWAAPFLRVPSCRHRYCIIVWAESQLP